MCLQQTAAPVTMQKLTAFLLASRIVLNRWQCAVRGKVQTKLLGISLRPH